jgi:hypothetical protein
VHTELEQTTNLGFQNGIATVKEAVNRGQRRKNKFKV